MITFEVVVLLASLVLAILTVRLTHAAHVPAWLENEIIVGPLMALLACGILFGLVGLVLSAEKLTGSPLVDVGIGIGGFILCAVILHFASKLADKAKHAA